MKPTNTPRPHGPAAPAVTVTDDNPADYIPLALAATKAKQRPPAAPAVPSLTTQPASNLTFTPSAAAFAQAGVQLQAPMPQQEAPAQLPAIELLPEDESQLSPVERLSRRDADWHRATGALTDAYRSGRVGAIMKLQQKQFDAMVARSDAAEAAHEYLKAQRLR